MRKDGVVTLVGDHRQLPPTISNVEVDVEGLGTSLFERLSSHGVEPFMLDIQYRSWLQYWQKSRTLAGKFKQRFSVQSLFWSGALLQQVSFSMSGMFLHHNPCWNHWKFISCPIYSHLFQVNVQIESSYPYFSSYLPPFIMLLWINNFDKSIVNVVHKVVLHSEVGL